MLLSGCFSSSYLLWALLRKRYIDADIQCRGGQVNQKCKDNTNGYITSGHCTHIYVCKADNYKSGPPKICTGGSADCPKGGDYPAPLPYRAPIVIASGSPMVAPTTISNVEQNVLNTVFGSSASTGIDFEEVSAAANAQLHALQGEPEGEAEFLEFSPESFDEETSAVFDSLRDSAIALMPGRLPENSAQQSIAERLAYASGGSFLAPAYGTGSGSDEETNGSLLLKGALSVPALFGKALSLAAQALIGILIADFSLASRHWHEAGAATAAAFSLLGDIVVLLFKMLLEYLTRFI